MILVFCSQGAIADVIATAKSGNGTVISLTSDDCPLIEDKKALKLSIERRLDGSFRAGCYVLNKDGNPVVQWEDAQSPEILNGNSFTFESKFIK
jgi:hypothetical protein